MVHLQDGTRFVAIWAQGSRCRAFQLLFFVATMSGSSAAAAEPAAAAVAPALSPTPKTKMFIDRNGSAQPAGESPGGESLYLYGEWVLVLYDALMADRLTLKEPSPSTVSNVMISRRGIQ